MEVIGMIADHPTPKFTRGGSVHDERKRLQSPDGGSAGFCPEESAKTRGIGYETERSPTLKQAIPAVVIWTL